MRLLCQTKFQILFAFVAVTFVCITGCKSQRGFPKLADLAWWQKDDARLAETLPPAAHFDPEPAIQMQASGKKNVRDEIKAIVAEAAKQNTDKERYALNGQPPVHPLRTPYSFESASDSNSESGLVSTAESEIAQKSALSSDNSFAATAGQIKTKLPDWNTSEFAAKSTDLNSAEPSSSNSLDVTKNEFEPASKTPISTPGSTARSGGDWRTNFALPANTSSGLDANIEAARKSLNRAEENAGNALAGFKQSLNGSFDRAAEPLGKLADKATEIKEQVANANEFQPNPQYDGFETAQNLVQQVISNSESELEQIQIAARKFQDNADQLQKLADQARQQAEELARQAMSASTPVSSGSEGQLEIQQQTPLPRADFNAFQPRVAQAPETPQLPTNSLRTSGAGMPSAGLTPIPVGNDSQNNQVNAYPSTTYGNYTPKTPATHQDRANADSGSSQTSFYGAPATPAGADSTGGEQVNANTEPHDSGEEISHEFVPAAIMSGNSSFAPGSVGKLVPFGK
jgi:hypothetical protein